MCTGEHVFGDLGAALRHNWVIYSSLHLIFKYFNTGLVAILNLLVSESSE
jgi:hypothetical protein